jgi:hypothetical protein
MCETLEVCPKAEFVTVACAYGRCGHAFQKRATDKRKRFCSTKCRVYASRASKHERRNAWTKERFKFKSFTFDGRFSGPNNPVGPLALFRLHDAGRPSPRLPEGK